VHPIALPQDIVDGAHTNSKSATCTVATFPNEDAFNSALLDKCEVEGIELIAVTDPWCVDRVAG
jgi:hypothetical protein